MVDAGRGNKEWRSVVALVGREIMMGRAPFTAALALRVTFVRPRPKVHYGARGIKASAPQSPTTKPDATKLLRALEDALTGICWIDDAQIVAQLVRKVYGAEPGAFVEVWKEQER
jgi:Holliday junction resolvase RusA-like endonuclease